MQSNKSCRAVLIYILTFVHWWSVCDVTFPELSRFLHIWHFKWIKTHQTNQKLVSFTERETFDLQRPGHTSMKTENFCSEIYSFQWNQVQLWWAETWICTTDRQSRGCTQIGDRTSHQHVFFPTACTCCLFAKAFPSSTASRAETRQELVVRLLAC